MDEKTNTQNICQRAFAEIEIDADGEVHTCCPSYLKKYSIGNIFKVNSFDEIWYSEKAINLRKHLLEEDYAFCNIDICNKKIDDKTIVLSEKPPYPKLVRFAYDTQCNLNCIFCRDKKIFNNADKNEKYNKMIEPLFLPMLKNASIMSLTSSGEFTASEHSLKLIKKAIERYPKLKLELLTNALLFSEVFCEKLGIVDRVDRIVISLHSLNKTTYEKLMRGSNLDIVKQNLSWIFSLKKNGYINEVSFVFVVSSLNYKEIPEFVKFCMENDANPIIWECRDFSNTKMSKEFYKYAVHYPEHPQYNSFVNVLKRTDELYPNQYRIPALFESLKPIRKIEQIKNIIKFNLKHLKTN